MFNEPENEEASEVVKRSHLTTSALKKDLQMADSLVDHFFEVDHFLDRCLKWKHGVASCKEVVRTHKGKAIKGHPFIH